MQKELTFAMVDHVFVFVHMIDRFSSVNVERCQVENEGLMVPIWTEDSVISYGSHHGV